MFSLKIWDEFEVITHFLAEEPVNNRSQISKEFQNFKFLIIYNLYIYRLIEFFFERKIFNLKENVCLVISIDMRNIQTK